MTHIRILAGLAYVAMRLLSAALVLFAIASTPAVASEEKGVSEAARPTSLSPVEASDFTLAVHPAVGKVGQPRTIFLRFQPPGGCIRNYAFSLDTSLAETQNLVVVRTLVTTGLCGLLPPPNPLRVEFELTPTKVGTITIRWDGGGPDITVQSLSAGIASKFDVNGMWFDAATNGSGIALHHHRATADIAFGTWFLYNNIGDSRWYTLQWANWQQDGSVLEGLLIQMRGGCPSTSLAACPAIGSFRADPPQNLFWVMPSLVRITFQSSTRARAEVFSLGGVVLFTSDLSRLQF